MERTEAVEQAVSILPQRLRRILLERPVEERASWEEIRLRLWGGLSWADATGRERPVTMASGKPVEVSQEELRMTLERASCGSLQSVSDKLAEGFLPVSGGHRLGVCGAASVREGRITSFRWLSGLNLRIACPVTGVGEDLLPRLMEGGRFQSTLILAPPGEGKTTLLRDLIRLLGLAGIRTGLADERGEVAALSRGIPQLDVGPLADVVDGCPKGEGLMLLLRAMSPQVLAVDEITHPRDVQALCQGANCGVSLLATAHGGSVAELGRRGLYRPLLEEGVFRQVILIFRSDGNRCYRRERLS